MTSSHSPQKITRHGVFMDVYDTGVLLIGDSGIGKSELGLGLIDRGHYLIADDSIIFIQEDDGKIRGYCPDTLQDFIEVRGLGILNIREMYGDKAIRASKTLELMVNIIASTPEELKNIDRIHGMQNTRTLLGQSIPEVSIPVIPGRNLAVLVEMAVRNFRLKLSGYTASEDFCERQRKFMKKRQKNEC